MKWSKEEVILLQELYPNYPTNDLVEIFHRNRDAINCKAKEMGIKKIDRYASNGIANKKYNINENYFNEKSRNMFYVLGFWCADGCICSSGGNKCFNIHIKNDDKYLLKNILLDMKSTHKLYENQTSVSINICNQKIYDSLINLGFTERKSLTLEFPLWIPKQYLNDFIRGYFDGDGSVDKNGYCVHIMGTKHFLISLKEILEQNNIRVHSIVQTNHKNSKSDIPHSLYVTRKDEVSKFGDFIYKDMTDNDLFLHRKKERFKMDNKANEKKIQSKN
ncbi:LAGLIDADG family homing endonuclease [Ruminococcus bicirculans (ex Wegman et al. 2014)]|uniref:LAGLIDADG family homing endonuclease n=1 Tax=Ruminococcus bicirculans (ex Wegman et al. 2014) TaxID=1160721 RepID=A0AAW6DUW5_9FIRM|nr:LAGLIDADG family homing endonuclease [Ruminococcus bicirculans (ex Wegman et al. 2014)]MDB8734539.1 LAGLIDADG family homing endonuclease [Ruminococcus bicirculans (ex Wegman et al. 2014)]MDB8741968.1 LAGLIDADG family homing endonuclease [Ruminococcus bicirculans (ex Wegman et al. 2014)]